MHDASHIFHPLLATKLRIPQSPLYAVSRDRLIEKMLRALPCKLTVVVAPPGFGKSIMISEWLRRSPAPLQAAWLSLDKEDNDLQRFWGYVIASVEGILPGVGQKALSFLQSSITVSIEHSLILLLNALHDLPHKIVLVWDDYHLLESEDIHRSVSFFLERLPEQVHLCMISRKTPPLPIGNFRAKGQLNEIGIADLKFNEDEISSFLHLQTKIVLAKEQIAQLASRTEGWIAGIQLATLSNSGDLNHTLVQFSGDHRYIVDYLIENVILQLPEAIRTFLFQTSILERMNDDLCAAVTGTPKEQQLLKSIERANLFLIPLDGVNRWYRYHHLFADFLRSRYKQQAGHEIRSLHQRASAWFEQNSYMEEAIEHTLHAGNYEKAVELIQRHAVPLFKRRQLETLRRWFNRMPESIVEHPAMLIIRAYTELLTGSKAAASNYIEKMERLAAEAYLADPHSLTAAQLQEETNNIATFHAWLHGDYDMAFKKIHQLYSRDALPGDEVARRLLFDIIDISGGKVPLISGHYGFYGKLNKAEEFHTLYDAFIRKHRLEKWHFVVYPNTAMSEIYYEKNHLEQALQYADSAIAAAEMHGSFGAYVPAIIVKARIRRAMGRPLQAIDITESAMSKLQQEQMHLSHGYDMLHAYLTRCHIENGATGPVEAWLQRNHFSMDLETVTNQEFEISTLIQVMIAKKKFTEALAWAERMLSAGQNKDSKMTMLNCYLLLAIIYDGIDDTYASMMNLHAALTLGEHEGYLRTLLELEQVSCRLMDKYVTLRKNNYMPELQAVVSMSYVKKLQVPVDSRRERQESVHKQSGSEYALTPREREVLKLTCLGLSNKEIAERLVLTVGTVKLHLNRIYGKLGVKGRIQAIQKARHLD
jgi:LuxR family maltose regulon positive regulatory protein